MVISDLAFSDDVINSTQLIRNWGHWAARAHNCPVTILYKDEPITLISRRYISELSRRLHYTNLVFSIYQFVEGRTGGCEALPWMNYLNEDSRREFFEDVLSAYTESDAKSNWSIIQDTLDDWRATAEVMSNPELSKRLLEKGDPSKYVGITD